MIERILLLSGPICSGKSELANLLVERQQMSRISTRSLLENQPRVRSDRGDLQRAGRRLDRTTDGQWVADALAREVFEKDGWLIVDSVRVQAQVDAIRRAFARRVVHVHLTAPVEVLAERYSGRRRPGDPESYEEARRDRTERAVDSLASTAEVAIDTARATPEDVYVRVEAALRLTASPPRQLVDVMIGAQYGSEGKGHIATHLAGEYSLLVRVGGPNAGHKVFLDPEPYTHHMLPSGTMFNQSARLLVGPGAVLNEDILLDEIAFAGVDQTRLSIDPNAVLIDEADITFESESLRGSIGSTAQGVGVATARRVLRGVGFDGEPAQVRRAVDSPDLEPFIRPAHEVLQGSLNGGERVFIEGTQGSALSLFHGPYPYVTSRDTNVSGCLAEVGVAPARVRRVIMVCRTYPIRVQSPSGGTSGGMRDITWKIVAERSGNDEQELERREQTSTTNRLRRVGEFEWDMFRRAVDLNVPTDLALTFTDYLAKDNERARRFEDLSDETIQFVGELEQVSGAPVSLLSTGFSHNSIIDRRRW